MWDWFLRYWSSVGLGGAIALGLLLFCTNVCRARLDVSRWRDPVWMAWMFSLAYLLHNFEEYGFDAKGQPFNFPLNICEKFGYASLAACPVKLPFFLAVNIPLIWIALPLAAVWSRRHPAVGLTGAGFVFVNGMTHVVAGIIAGYNPGLLTAVTIFLPLFIWTAITFFGPGKLLRRPVLAAIVFASALVHVLLFGLVFAQIDGMLGMLAANVVQTVVAPLFLLGLPWIAERKWPPTPATLNDTAVTRAGQT